MSDNVDKNVEDNCKFLRERSTVGFEKYGCPTTDIEALASIQHLKEELGDGLNYIAQVKRQMENLIEENQKLKAGLIGDQYRTISVAFLAELIQLIELVEDVEGQEQSVSEAMDRISKIIG